MILRLVMLIAFTAVITLSLLVFFTVHLIKTLFVAPSSLRNWFKNRNQFGFLGHLSGYVETWEMFIEGWTV